MSTVGHSSDRFPVEYRPYDEIILCSNRFTHVRHILEVDDEHPLLIGKGDVPEIWIRAPIDNTRKRWGFVVNKNIALHPDIKVIIGTQEIRVTAGSTTVLAVGPFDDRLVVVAKLDFRPFGMNIVGDRNGLQVGKQTLRASSFERSRVGIAIS